MHRVVGMLMITMVLHMWPQPVWFTLACSRGAGAHASCRTLKTRRNVVAGIWIACSTSWRQMISHFTRLHSLRFTDIGSAIRNKNRPAGEKVMVCR